MPLLIPTHEPSSRSSGCSTAHGRRKSGAPAPETWEVWRGGWGQGRGWGRVEMRSEVLPALGPVGELLQVLRQVALGFLGC